MEHCKFGLRLISAIVILASIANPLYSEVRIKAINANTVGLYEKFELVLDLGDAEYENPYDPGEIDVTAVFSAPSGKEWRIFGFYDDYRNADKWKVRFSPDETGEWNYRVSVTDVNGTEQTDTQRFTAVPSEYHGWVHVSSENPHYLEYDDGQVFYGVGLYTPWRNTVETFDILERYGANMFGIWNIMYGGMVGEAGIIEEELGRYNQEKCGRIDSLLKVAEERDLKCMLAIWPHDLFSDTVWAHQWHQNPYSTICDVVDVYADELCWEYQQRKYRYLIARWAHSRAFGIWEIINEINGTDGWAAGRTDEAKNWVHKVHAYFSENDPYRHPTTASRSGGYGEYWPEMYELIDLPNLHVYESQGWPQKYAGDPLRSSVVNYAFAALRFWQNFDKPAIFGETGADLVYVDVHSPDYTALFHNAIWACLTNGLAATPIWWTYNNPIGVVEWGQMAHLSRFVQDIDFITESRDHFETNDEDYDVYGMKGDSTAFGWIRQGQGQDISGGQFSIENAVDPDIKVCAVSYYNTWTGDYLDTHVRPCVNGTLKDRIPELDGAPSDVAFKLSTTKGGDTPSRLELSVDSYLVLNIDTLSIPVTCFLIDEEKRFCPRAENVITFALQGPGVLSGSADVTASDGVATTIFQATRETGIAKIFVCSPGLEPDSVEIRVKDRVILDDFEDYESDTDLRTSWETKSGTTADVYLDSSQKGSGGFAMRLEYGIGDEYKIFARIEKEICQDYTGGNSLTFWMKPDDSKRDIEIKIVDGNRKIWRYTYQLAGAEPREMMIPITHFECASAPKPMDLSALRTITLTINQGSGLQGTGTIFFDDFSFPESDLSGAEGAKNSSHVEHFVLLQNYPNPFNPSTAITYDLPRYGQVNVSIYNTTGQKIDTLIDTAQTAGKHEVIWDASRFAAGVYFYKIQAAGYAAIKKCVLVK